jgi:hypothetical protein
MPRAVVSYEPSCKSTFENDAVLVACWHFQQRDEIWTYNYSCSIVTFIKDYPDTMLSSTAAPRTIYGH